MVKLLLSSASPFTRREAAFRIADQNHVAMHKAVREALGRVTDAAEQADAIRNKARQAAQEAYLIDLKAAS